MDIVQINEWIKILEPVGGLILGVVGGLMILVLWHKLKPWLELRDRKTIEKKQRIKELKQILKGDRSNEARKKASTEFWKLVVVDGVQIFILIFVFVLIIVLISKANKYFENDLWETRNQMVQMIDEFKHDLYLRTVREPLNPNCVGENNLNFHENDQCSQYWEREHDILNRQLLCQLKASLESYKYKNATDDISRIKITKITYQVCMMEEGWFTEQCFKDVKDCVELWYAESTCIALKRDWLKFGGRDAVIRMCEESETW